MSKKLIIVESPAKIKTLKNFLGSDFVVEASMGHVRDLPAKELGVDVNNNFKPKYSVLADRKKVLDNLKKKAASAETVFLATDPDREGEAIAWHLQQALKLKTAERIEFNEITESAVQRAIQNPRTIDESRVNAQQARRILDRLVGYKISPLLWRTLSRKTLSAGRVQSVAVKLIVDREREIRAFVPEEYWTILAELTPADKKYPFTAELKSKGKEKIALKNETDAKTIENELNGAEYRVMTVSARDVKKRPFLPFITSSLQQESSRKCGFTAKKTMRVAQSLYEGVELGAAGPVGLITYMRTDSTRVAEEAKKAALDYIVKTYGKQYAGGSVKATAKKARVQDAHEAIRPTDVNRTPDSIKSYLSAEQFKLYQLIWNRFVSSQMSDAVFSVTTVDISATLNDKASDPYIFKATGSVLKFDGWRKVYNESKDDNTVADEDKMPLPALTAEELLKLLKLKSEQHFTQPPPRYTEATLVKTLEQNGVGRPSTYATILETIRERKYVEMEKKAFVPTLLGETVNDYLVERFSDILDVKFTAFMEDELDKVEESTTDWLVVLNEFYKPFSDKLEKAGADKEKIDLPTGKFCPTCNKPMVIRTSRKGGEFYACSGYPDCTTTAPVGVLEMKCPKCEEGEIIERRTRKGKIFYGCTRYPNCDFASWDKPVSGACPQCGAHLVAAKGREKAIKCGANCGYKRSIEDIESEIASEASAQE